MKDNNYAINLQKPFVVFAGAGISLGEPSRAPLWNEMRSDTISRLFDILIEANKRWNSNIPFDTLKDHCLGKVSVPEVFFEAARVTIGTNRFISRMVLLLSGREPNICHKAIATLVQKRLVTAIVTTNFDPYLEIALRDRNVKFLKLVGLQEGDYDINSEDIVLFKVHGCVENPKTMLFTLNRSAQPLSTVGAMTLRKILSEKNILICGYSGFDMDIFPLLKAIIEQNTASGFKTWVNNPPPMSSWGPVKQLVNEGLAEPVLLDSGLLLGSFAFDSPQEQIRSRSRLQFSLAHDIEPFDASFLAAWSFFQAGEFLPAYKLFELCEDIAVDNEDYSAKAAACGGLAVCCSELGWDWEANLHANISQKASTMVDMEDLRERDHLWMWKAAFCQRDKTADPKDAQALYDSAIFIEELRGGLLGNWWGIIKAEGYIRKSVLLHKMNNFDDAAKTFREGISFSEQHGLVALEIECRGQYADLLDQLGKVQEAIKQRSKVISLRALCGL